MMYMENELNSLLENVSLIGNKITYIKIKDKALEIGIDNYCNKIEIKLENVKGPNCACDVCIAIYIDGVKIGDDIFGFKNTALLNKKL